jgi:hypothetical protein
MMIVPLIRRQWRLIESRDRLLGPQSSDAATIHGCVNVSCQRIYPDSLSGPDLGGIEIQFQYVGDKARDTPREV